ncbi:hypothetical protein Tco_0131539, partial [Tanacetum coccineum]
VDSTREILNKGDLRDYWIGISSARDFLGIAPSCTAIQDPILRLCHRLIACSIAGRSQAAKKVTVMDLFYLRGIDIGSVNVSYLLARRYFKDWILQGLTVIALELLIIDMAELADLAPVQAPPPPPPPATSRTMLQRMARLEEDLHEIRRALTEQREVVDTMAHDFSRFSTWAVTCLTRMMDRTGVTYT